GSYPLGFRTRLHRKDLGIALAAARDLAVVTPVAALVEQWETGLVTQCFGDEDVSNIARVVRRQSGLDDLGIRATTQTRSAWTGAGVACGYASNSTLVNPATARSLATSSAS